VLSDFEADLTKFFNEIKGNFMNNDQLIEEISLQDLEQRIEFGCCGGGGGGGGGGGPGNGGCMDVGDYCEEA
jgi:hypothetical protein